MEELKLWQYEKDFEKEKITHMQYNIGCIPCVVKTDSMMEFDMLQPERSRAFRDKN